MKAVVHRRRQPQCDEAAVAEAFSIDRPAQQIREFVRKALGLKYPGTAYRAAGADDGVARAHQNARPLVHRPRTGPEPAGKASVDAVEFAGFGVRQIELGKHPPDRQRQAAQETALDARIPPHQLRRRGPRDAIGQQKIEIVRARENVSPRLHTVSGCGTRTPHRQPAAGRPGSISSPRSRCNGDR